MKTTNQFARLISATEIEFAPTVVVIDGQTIAVNPDAPNAAEIYARCSPRYLPYCDEPPTVKPPSYARPVGYEEQGGIVRRVYEIVTPPPQPKIYSTADAIEALMKEGVYPQCREWIEQQGLRDMMLATKEFSGDDENFQMILDGLQELLGWDDAKVAEILEQAEVG